MLRFLIAALAGRGIFSAISGPLCLILSVAAVAQERTVPGEAWKEAGAPYLRNHAPKEYGENPQNWAVVQDDRGIVYVANLNGVLEFDGVFWRRIETPRQTWALSLAKDGDGTIYAGSFGDFGYLAPDSLGRMQFVSLLEHVAPEDRDFAEVWRIHCIPDGVYFWTRNRLFRWSDNQIRVWKSASFFFLSSIANDTLYVEESGSGLLRMINDSLHVVPASKPLSPMRITAMLPYDRLHTLVCTMQGLFLFDGRTFSPFESQANAFIRRYAISNAVALPDGRFAIATYGGGACIIDREGKIHRLLDRSAGLLSQDVKNLYCDREGTIWMALSAGLAYVRLRDPFSFFTEAQGLEGSVVSVCRHRGSLYAASSQGIFRLLPAAQNPKFTAPLFKRVEGIADQGFWLLPAGRKLLAAAHGVYQIDGDKASLVDPGKETAFVLHRSLQDTNRVYAGLKTGLEILLRQNEKWVSAGRVKGIHEEIRTIEEKDGIVWLGTIFQGVLRIELTSRDSAGWNANVTRYGKSHGLPGGPANVSRVNGELVFGSEKGIRYFDEARQKFSPYTVVAAELADTTRPAPMINEDRFGQIFAFVFNEERTPALWILRPQNGKYLLDKNQFRSLVNFGLFHSVFTDADSVIWVGCSSGLVRFDPRIPKDYTVAYPPLLRRVTIIRTNSVVYGGRAGAQLQSPILPHRHNSLHFEFALPFFEEIGENRYQYKLDGFDDSWSEWTKEAKRDYTNLPDAAHSFRVRAQNVFRQQSEEAHFDFRILPSWYRSWWAYVLYVVAAGGLVAAVVKMRVRQLERKTAELERIVAERTGTIREQAEKLKELDHMKSRFFANISHEFRTPLTLILGPLEDVIAKVKDKAAKDDLRVMERNARRLLRLINQLLDLSRLEAGRMRLQASRGDVVAFLKGVVMSFASLADQKRIALKFEEAPALASVESEFYFDHDKVEKILYNLLSNAFKFTPQGGSVLVRIEMVRVGDGEAGREGEGERKTESSQSPAHPLSLSPIQKLSHLQITVRDTGIGIPPERLPYIFNRFNQADDTHTREYEGAGIGLALTKELVERHYGTIDVRSEAGKGTKFIVRLPMGLEHFEPEEIVEEAAGEQSSAIGDQLAVTYDVGVEGRGAKSDKRQATSDARPATGRKAAKIAGQPEDRDIILVVDDHPDMRMFIRRYLEPAYQVIEAKDGREGIDVTLDAIPDLVISDVMMPRLDGYQLCEALKTNEKTSHIPIILLTAKAGEEDKLSGLETGADDYLVKPFNSKELHVRVKNLIELRRKLRERFRREGLLQPREVAVPSIEEAFLQKLMQVMEQHLADEGFGIDELSAALAMGRKQLYRKIKALTGQAPTDFIRTIRLQRAKQLLVQHAGTVSEIAYQVGFNNLSYFARCFKEEFGELPSELSKSS